MDTDRRASSPSNQASGSADEMERQRLLDEQLIAAESLRALSESRGARPVSAEVPTYSSSTDASVQCSQAVTPAPPPPAIQQYQSSFKVPKARQSSGQNRSRKPKASCSHLQPNMPGKRPAPAFDPGHSDRATHTPSAPAVLQYRFSCSQPDGAAPHRTEDRDGGGEAKRVRRPGHKSAAASHSSGAGSADRRRVSAPQATSQAAAGTGGSVTAEWQPGLECGTSKSSNSPATASSAATSASQGARLVDRRDVPQTLAQAMWLSPAVVKSNAAMQVEKKPKAGKGEGAASQPLHMPMPLQPAAAAAHSIGQPVQFSVVPVAGGAGGNATAGATAVSGAVASTGAGGMIMASGPAAAAAAAAPMGMVQYYIQMPPSSDKSQQQVYTSAAGTGAMMPLQSLPPAVALPHTQPAARCPSNASHTSQPVQISISQAQHPLQSPTDEHARPMQQVVYPGGMTLLQPTALAPQQQQQRQQLQQVGGAAMPSNQHVYVMQQMPGQMAGQMAGQMPGQLASMPSMYAGQQLAPPGAAAGSYPVVLMYGSGAGAGAGAAGNLPGSTAPAGMAAMAPYGYNIMPSMPAPPALKQEQKQSLSSERLPVAAPVQTSQLLYANNQRTSLPGPATQPLVQQVMVQQAPANVKGQSAAVARSAAIDVASSGQKKPASAQANNRTQVKLGSPQETDNVLYLLSQSRIYTRSISAAMSSGEFAWEEFIDTPMQCHSLAIVGGHLVCFAPSQLWTLQGKAWVTCSYLEKCSALTSTSSSMDLVVCCGNKLLKRSDWMVDVEDNNFWQFICDCEAFSSITQFGQYVLGASGGRVSVYDMKCRSKQWRVVEQHLMIRSLAIHECTLYGTDDMHHLHSCVLPEHSAIVCLNWQRVCKLQSAVDLCAGLAPQFLSKLPPRRESVPVLVERTPQSMSSSNRSSSVVSPTDRQVQSSTCGRLNPASGKLSTGHSSGSGVDRHGRASSSTSLALSTSNRLLGKAKPSEFQPVLASRIESTKNNNGSDEILYLFTESAYLWKMTSVGDFECVTKLPWQPSAMAYLDNMMYAVADKVLYRAEVYRAEVKNDGEHCTLREWSCCEDTPFLSDITSHRGKLCGLGQNFLWAREDVSPGWIAIGRSEATAIASASDYLFVASRNKLYSMPPDPHSSQFVTAWYEVGPATKVWTMTAAGLHLYSLCGNVLWNAAVLATPSATHNWSRVCTTQHVAGLFSGPKDLPGMSTPPEDAVAPVAGAADGKGATDQPDSTTESAISITKPILAGNR